MLNTRIYTIVHNLYVFSPSRALSPVYTRENFPWTGNFSLSGELPCATNGFKTKEIFLSKENFPVCKRALCRVFIT